MWDKLEQYGEEIIVYTLDPKPNKLSQIAITKANELCELDGGRELVVLYE